MCKLYSRWRKALRSRSLGAGFAIEFGTLYGAAVGGFLAQPCSGIAAIAAAICYTEAKSKLKAQFGYADVAVNVKRNPSQFALKICGGSICFLLL